jgi:phenylpyruvate tautomerase PptA (4-oxalocrotonate tautomerase family)
MLRRGGSREVRNVGFPVVNSDGPDRLVNVYCKASLDQHGNPTIPTGPDDVIRRYRGASLEHNPLYTFFDTDPRIGMEIYVDGNSLDLAFVIADRMARYGYLENRMIIATGCLRGNDGKVGRVDGFERKTLLLHKSDLRGFLFVFPKGNVIETTREALQRLQDDCRAECLPIENLDEIKFLWEAGIDRARPVKWRWSLTALALLALVSFSAVLLVPIEKPLPAPPPPLNASLDKRINTASDNGAYQMQFCPRLLAAVAKVLFRDYWCATSRGTVENIDRALGFPMNIGLAQLDILADEAMKRVEEVKKIVVIRTDACEGLWMVTRNPGLKTYENVRDNASRIRFILPKDSGSAASFAFLQANDRDRLGRVSDAKKHYMDDTTAVLNEVARSNDEAVGFFVQSADPENANFKLIAQTGLTIIPVIGNEILDILQWDGQPVYQEKTFETNSGRLPGMFNIFARKVTTACTPLTIITGKPEAFGSGEDKVNQRDLIKKISEVSKNLLPHQSRTVAIIIYLKSLAMQAMEEAGALVERIRKAVAK